jgi:hypothetical protein
MVILSLYVPAAIATVQVVLSLGSEERALEMVL